MARIAKLAKPDMLARMARLARIVRLAKLDRLARGCLAHEDGADKHKNDEINREVG